MFQQPGPIIKKITKTEKKDSTVIRIRLNWNHLLRANALVDQTLSQCLGFLKSLLFSGSLYFTSSRGLKSLRP